MSVNASPRELRRDFVRAIAQQLRLHDLPPERLTVEITESTAMHDAGAASPLLAELAGLGVQVAIDDFGDGFSSLGRLRRMPVSQLKIDRSFMRDVPDDPGAAAVVTAVVGLGRALGSQVVAEGVETEAQRVFLRDHDCGYAQGFHLARPLTAADATALLLRNGA
jgi:EAL domain-containing protein (putative c-di-GMP-specific phosphodiesterase class I)